MDIKIQLAIAANIRYLRKMYGYTQEEVSDRIHISRSTYASYESGCKIPATDTLINLADVYNISMSTLLECDNMKFLYDVISSETVPGNMENLIDIFNRLSPASRNMLMEKAEMLLELESRKAQPGHGHRL